VHEARVVAVDAGWVAGDDVPQLPADEGDPAAEITVGEELAVPVVGDPLTGLVSDEQDSVGDREDEGGEHLSDPAATVGAEGDLGGGERHDQEDQRHGEQRDQAGHGSPDQPDTAPVVVRAGTADPQVRHDHTGKGLHGVRLELRAEVEEGAVQAHPECRDKRRRASGEPARQDVDPRTEQRIGGEPGEPERPAMPTEQVAGEPAQRHPSGRRRGVRPTQLRPEGRRRLADEMGTPDLVVPERPGQIVAQDNLDGNERTPDRGGQDDVPPHAVTDALPAG
jgi:hypothetical protein